MSVQIKVVESKKELKTFVRFANNMYKDNKYYVPAIVFDELNTFDKEKNGAFEFCEAELYLAYKDSKVVGRVAAIINHKANEHITTNDYISMYDDDYEEIIPLYDIFQDGFTFDEYYREKILLDTSLCYKDGRELGVCLNDLCLKYKPNKK